MRPPVTHRLGRLLAAFVLLSSTIPVVQVTALTCNDVHVVWARGSLRPEADPEGNQFINEDLFDRIPAAVSVGQYRLGTGAGFGGFDYPAVGGIVDWAIGGYLDLPGPYADSVAAGRGEFEAYLEDRAAACPSEVYVVGGWSEGAQVIGESLNDDIDAAIRNRIAFVAFFGDPTLDTGNEAPITPVAPNPYPGCDGNERPWIRGTAICSSFGGIFGNRVPYVPADIEQRVGSWCRAGDGACEGLGLQNTQVEHSAYFEPGSDSALAALEASIALQGFLPAFEFDISWFPFSVGMTGADLGFVFDTTGSMGGYIADAKANATDLAQTWLDTLPNARVGLVEFRDHTDPFVARLNLGLTDVVADFQTAVNGLSAGGGGDIPEAALSGAMTALNQLEWRPGATKVLVVITDAPGKDPEPVTGYTVPIVVQRALEIDPVAIYTVNASNLNSVTTFFTPLADGTAGEVLLLQPGQTLSDALFEVLDIVALNPVATLNGPYVSPIGQPIEFSTYPSFDPDGELVSFEWDFDGDGAADQTTTAGNVTYTYPGQFNGIAAVRVVSSDGGSALASAEVTVDSVGLRDRYPLAPAAATATVSGPSEVTVSWTPSQDDGADDYRVYFADGTLAGFRLSADPHSIVISGVDFTEPVTFLVGSANEVGISARVQTLPVGGSPAIATSRVSESTTHGQGNGVSDDSYISADGRFVTYRSTSSNLVTDDTNVVMDVFVHDRLTETTSRASLDAAGVEGNANSDDSAISADGRYVVFKSQASNFVTGDTNATSWDIFRKDLRTGAIVRVSTSSAGAQSNGASHDPVISADGRYVAFRSSASNLVTGDTNGQQDVFRKDVETGTTIRVSVSSAGAQGNALSDDPQISDDGNRIAFHSDATTLVTGDTNGHRDVFVRDVAAGTTVRASVSTAGTQGNGLSAEVAMSGDGTTLAWESDASNLVSGDTNAKTDIFVHVLATGVTSRVSVSGSGTQGTKASEDPSLSGTGAIIAFDSLASNLISGDTNSRKDIFIKDLATGVITRMSVDNAGIQGDDTSRNPSLSGDGTTVAFESQSTNLVANDTNGTEDVFVRGPSLAQ